MRHLRSFTISSLLLAATPAFAGGGGMPQLDPVWFPNQLFWLVVSFALLYLVVARVIAPQIGGVLADRENAIASAIAEAETAKREAESTRGDFESTAAAARTRAAELMAAAAARSNADTADALAKLDHDLARKAEHAQARLNEAVAKASSGVEAATVSLASAMAEKLLGHTVPAESVTDAVKPLAKAS
jgi:F-type H+-transporting ATPase subunit b